MPLDLQKAALDLRTVFRAAATAFSRGAKRPVHLADEFFATVASLPIGGPHAALANAVFAGMIQDLELLPGDRVFEPAMFAGEVLAGCRLRSDEYTRIAQEWARRPNPVGMLCVGGRVSPAFRSARKSVTQTG